jgi:hypothetical protein
MRRKRMSKRQVAKNTARKVVITKKFKNPHEVYVPKAKPEVVYLEEMSLDNEAFIV